MPMMPVFRLSDVFAAFRASEQFCCILLLSILPGCMLLFPANTAMAQQSPADPQMLFNEGNFYFAERNYRQALSKYHLIEEQGQQSGPLFLNMALAYNNLEQHGLALFYFRQASAFPEVRTQAQEGELYVSETLFRRFGEIPVLNTWSWRYSLLFKAGYPPFLLISLLLFNACLLGWAAQWFYPKWRTHIRYLVLFSFLTLIPVSVVSYWLWSVNDRYEPGMIVQETVSLREAPGMQSRVLLELTPGFQFIKDQQQSKLQPGYISIQLSNGMNGWVPAESARILSTL